MEINSFDEYKESRSTLQKEERIGRLHSKLSCIVNLLWWVSIPAGTNIICHHMAVLLSMLKDQFLHHSFDEATATLETITMAMDRVPELMRTVGVTVLAQEGLGQRETLQMLKHMFAWQQHKHVIWWTTCEPHVIQSNTVTHVIVNHTCNIKCVYLWLYM